MEKSKRNLSSLVQVVIFSAFIGVFFLINLLTPSKAFSENENRNLEQLPEFSFSSLFSGDFTADFESYVSDQFFLRESWISLKSFSELSVFRKNENNGVYLGSDGSLLTKFDEPDDKRLQTNVDAVNRLTAGAGVPVYLSLIPSPTEIWSYKLPDNAPSADQKALIEKIYALSNSVDVDTYSALYEHRDEYIYYHTDHHWTTLGAYYAYVQLMDAVGLDAQPLDSFTATVRSESFYGTTYSNSGIRIVKPDTITTYVEPWEGLEISNYSDGTPKDGVLYDESFLGKKDKYSMFFGGNTPMLDIKTGNEGGRLLILRDSYTDSELPFLLEHFSEIFVIDLRYYKASIISFVQENAIDLVLVNYSLSNFCTDSSVAFAGR